MRYELPIAFDIPQRLSADEFAELLNGLQRHIDQYPALPDNWRIRILQSALDPPHQGPMAAQYTKDQPF